LRAEVLTGKIDEQMAKLEDGYAEQSAKEIDAFWDRLNAKHEQMAEMDTAGQE
jgi:hypothetical protein